MFEQYDPNVQQDNNAFLARADSLSVRSIESKDSEVTAPPTPRSTDSEEEHQARQKLLHSQQVSAQMFKHTFSNSSRGSQKRFNNRGLKYQ